MIVEALDFQTDRELLVNVTFASADRFDVCLLQDRGCHTSPTLEPTSRVRIPPLGKNSPLPICLALLELTIADLSQTMEGTTRKDNRGGTREGAGARPAYIRSVEDSSKFPRLETFFSKKSSPSAKTSAMTSAKTSQSVQAGTKRARSSLHEATPSTPVMFAPPKEPPDIAPAASSFLLGNKGMIAQALVALKTGNSP